MTLNGGNATTNWDPTTRDLEVQIGGLDPGEKAEVIIYGTISNTAYGQEIHNIAQVTADNDDPEEDEAKVVDVEDGDPDGTISTKVASVSSARPGDEYYYTITPTVQPRIGKSPSPIHFQKKSPTFVLKKATL